MNHRANIKVADIAGHEMQVLAALRITPPQRGKIRCPFPNHEDRNPSWRWDHNSQRFFCSCGSGDVLDAVQRTNVCDFLSALAFCQSVIGGHLTVPRPSSPQPSQQTRPTTPKRWSPFAQSMWDKCQPISGTAQAYLEARGCALPPPESDLKWHPELRHGPCGYVGPALVALVTDTMTNEPLTLHRTWIMADGSKAPVVPARMFLPGHQVAGGVVRLWPDEAVTNGLGIAEGIETALSAAVGFAPVWAALVANNIRSFPVLDLLEELTILADHDPAGLAAAEVCARRWTEADKRVRTCAPPEPGTDFNEWLQQ